VKMKGQILKRLKSENDVISGEALSSELGISRVSIWKHIRKLQELGYEIVTTSSGYRFQSSPDVLFPWEFPGREKNIHYYDEIGSTMDIARDMGRKGCPHFTVVIAGQQSKGRGRMKRVWLSSTGGLYFTIVIRPEISPAISHKVNFAASLVLTEVLRKNYEIDAMVKWPNDILVEGKKLSGSLSEMEVEADIVSFVNIGIGLNVNNDPHPEEQEAVSMKKILGREVSRKEILSKFLDEFEKKIDSIAYDEIIPEWKKYTMTINRHVKIVTIDDVTEGLAVDVDENGALILELSDGSRKTIVYGDCFHKDP
jgi:BirA family biotin operon repressor/biotin-[acetyl-CoA-carboxylase] ligase